METNFCIEPFEGGDSHVGSKIARWERYNVVASSFICLNGEPHRLLGRARRNPDDDRDLSKSVVIENASCGLNELKEVEK